MNRVRLENDTGEETAGGGYWKRQLGTLTGTSPPLRTCSLATSAILTVHTALFERVVERTRNTQHAQVIRKIEEADLDMSRKGRDDSVSMTCSALR